MSRAQHQRRYFANTQGPSHLICSTLSLQKKTYGTLMRLTASIYPQYSPLMCPSPPKNLMAKKYQQLLEGVTNATHKAGAVRALAEIMVGRCGTALVLAWI